MQAIENAITAGALPKKSDRIPSDSSPTLLAQAVLNLRLVVRHQPHVAAGVIAYWLGQHEGR